MRGNTPGHGFTLTVLSQRHAPSEEPQQEVGCSNTETKTLLLVSHSDVRVFKPVSSFACSCLQRVAEHLTTAFAAPGSLQSQPLDVFGLAEALAAQGEAAPGTAAGDDSSKRSFANLTQTYHHFCTSPSSKDPSLIDNHSGTQCTILQGVLCGLAEALTVLRFGFHSCLLARASAFVVLNPSCSVHRRVHDALHRWEGSLQSEIECTHIRRMRI